MVSVGIMSRFSNHSYSSESENDTVSFVSFDDAVVSHDATAAVPHNVTAAIAQRDEARTFSNISLTSANGIHVGNNTFYQAPVYKINRFVYANDPNKATENVGVVNDKQNEVLFADNKVYFNKDNWNTIPGVFKDRLVKAESEAPDLVHNEKSRSNTTQIKILSCVALCIILLICVIPNVIFLLSPDATSPTNKAVDGNATTANKANRSSARRHRFSNVPIPVHAWHGIPPPVNHHLIHPIPFVIAVHSQTNFCYINCHVNMKRIETLNLGKGHSDVGHNFFIGGDGYIYEGRGWYARNLMHDMSITICFIGNFKYDRLTQKMIDSTTRFLDQAALRGLLVPNYALLVYNQTYVLEDPGRNVYKIIKTWPHFRAHNGARGIKSTYTSLINDV